MKWLVGSLPIYCIAAVCNTVIHRPLRSTKVVRACAHWPSDDQRRHSSRLPKIFALRIRTACQAGAKYAFSFSSVSVRCPARVFWPVRHRCWLYFSCRPFLVVRTATATAAASNSNVKSVDVESSN